MSRINAGTPSTTSYSLTLFQTPLTTPSRHEMLEAKLEEKTSDDTADWEARLLAINENSLAFSDELEQLFLFISKEKKFHVLTKLVHSHSPAEKRITDPRLDKFWRKVLDYSPMLKPHRFKDQSEAIPDQQKPFDILAGDTCYIEYQKAKTPDEKNEWLLRGESFGNYLCMDRLNRQDVDQINQAVESDSKNFVDPLEPILKRARLAADLHGTLGYGLLAETYHRLGKYFHKRLLRERDMEYHPEDVLPSRRSGCHQAPRPPLKKATDYPPDPQRFLLARNTCYRQALSCLTTAIALESQSENLIHNATQNRRSYMAVCSWTYHSLPTLKSTQDYYQKLLASINLSPLINFAISEGENAAKEVLAKFEVVEPTNLSLPRP